MPILDHFELLAPFYDRVIKLQDIERLVQYAGLPTPGLILDAGGGTGRVAQALKDFASQVIVADASLGMLQQAKIKDGLYVVCSETEKLPFPDGLFDRVIMVDALHHVYDQENTISELLRVLKPNGRVLIEEPDIRLLSVKLVALAEKLAFMRSHFLSPTSIAALFSSKDAQVQIEKDGFNSWVIAEKF
jgi:ubiquinone/menaquinone biosynthesis C-methylase UbiE